MSEIRIKPIIHQYNFLRSEAKHTGLIAGMGSGKSYAGVLKTIVKHVNECQDVAYYLPTYRLIKDIAFPKFLEMLETLKINHRLKETDKEIITDYGKIMLRTMEDPQNIIGYEVGYSLIDEADILPKDKMELVFSKILERNRSNKTKNCVDFVSTPEGFKFLYNFFIKEGNSDRVLIKAKTADNHHLPPDYIDNLKANHSLEKISAYLNGEFVNLTSGSVYNQYDRSLNDSNITYSNNDALIVGIDFNITNMSAVILVKRGDEFHAIGEITKGYDTEDLAQKIIKKYPNNPIYIYPDASCKARKSVGFSDHDVLKRYFANIQVSSVNPAVRQRVNLVNSLLCNANEQRKLFLNKKECPNLTVALEALTYDKNGEPDKKSGYDHITDALGYPLFSIMQPNRGGYVSARG